MRVSAEIVPAKLSYSTTWRPDWPATALARRCEGT
jgi:hypothetical protein